MAAVVNTPKQRTRKQRTPSPNASSFRVWREREILEAIGVGRTTLWRWVREGNFPTPIRMGAAAKGWPEEIFRAWLSARKAA